MNNFKLMSCLVTLGLFGVANAEEANVPEILRDGIALADELMVRPEDRDTTDTAIVASNMGPRPALVICSAFNANGNVLGAARMRVPRRGLRYLRASDLSNGVDYVGQVRCRSANANIFGSAFLIGPGGVTNLPVQQQTVNGSAHIQAVVTASF